MGSRSETANLITLYLSLAVERMFLVFTFLLNSAVEGLPQSGQICAQVICCGSNGVTYPTPCSTPTGVTCVDYNECPAAEPPLPPEGGVSYGSLGKGLGGLQGGSVGPKHLYQIRRQLELTRQIQKPKDKT